MTLSPAQLRTLAAIHEGRGSLCVRGYRFASADILSRRGLIKGEMMTPFWTWRLTESGLQILRLAISRPSE